MDPFWTGCISTFIGFVAGVIAERRRYTREIRDIHEAYRIRIKDIHAEWEKEIRVMMGENLRMVGAVDNRRRAIGSRPHLRR